jgi:hypothetical protein
MAIIPVTSSYYICRSFSPEKETLEDHKAEQTEFTHTFEQLFTAAGDGDLPACKSIVFNKGFFDFKAFSVGRFAAPNGDLLDAVSIIQIAEKHEHTEIVKFFKEQEQEQSKKKASHGESSLSKIPLSEEKRKQYYREQITNLHKLEKLEQKDEYNNMSLYVLNVIQSSYVGSPAIRFENRLNNSFRQLNFLKTRVEQQFLGDHAEEKKVRMQATIDYLEKRFK